MHFVQLSGGVLVEEKSAYVFAASNPETAASSSIRRPNTVGATSAGRLLRHTQETLVFFLLSGAAPSLHHPLLIQGKCREGDAAWIGEPL